MDPITEYLNATWAITGLPEDIRKQGPWGQLNAWDHARLRGEVKRFAVSGDVWIHATGMTYYMHLRTQRAIVTLPGPTCTCTEFLKGGDCIHVRLVNVLRGPA